MATGRSIAGPGFLLERAAERHCKTGFAHGSATTQADDFKRGQDQSCSRPQFERQVEGAEPGRRRDIIHDPACGLAGAVGTLQPGRRRHGRHTHRWAYTDRDQRPDWFFVNTLALRSQIIGEATWTEL